MKKYLITGLITFLPVVLTTWIVIFLFDFFTTPFIPIISTILKELNIIFPESIAIVLSRIISLFFLIILIFILGFFARHILVPNLGKFGIRIISRIPIVNTIYNLSRDIIRALFSPDSNHVFKQTVMIPFPDRPHFCIGFSVGNAPQECEEKLNEELIAVFSPTAPHPISGFIFFVPKKDVNFVTMTKEDAIKFIVSGGIIHPEYESPIQIDCSK